MVDGGRQTKMEKNNRARVKSIVKSMLLRNIIPLKGSKTEEQDRSYSLASVCIVLMCNDATKRRHQKSLSFDDPPSIW